MTQRVLFCGDVFVEVLDHLTPDDSHWDCWEHSTQTSGFREGIKPRRDLQRALVSCALTYRALSQPALSRLWRVLDHPVFLLKVLPWNAGDDLFDEILVSAMQVPRYRI